jgi:tRNA threonylcarbamoyladenosine dehydratase
MTHDGSYEDRFARISMLLGTASLETLSSAHVTVVGLGAVGSFALEALARTGIGKLRLVDFDVVRPSNTNRQLLALSDSFGKKKADVARDRVHQINPECKVEIFERFFDPDGFSEVFREPTDFVIDAIDSLGPKVSLLSLLCRNEVPVVSSMGAARKTNPALIHTGDISEASVCRLAKRLRKRLHKEGIYCGIRCVFSTEELLAVSARSDNPSEEIYRRGRARIPFGSLVFVPAAFGIRVAYEAFRFITVGRKFSKDK